MSRAITVELLKLRRSLVVRITTAAVAIVIPLLTVGFMAIANSGGAGAAALKAQAMVVGEGWEAYLGLLGQMVTVALFIGPGVVATWAFGREHAERTFPSLFALPVTRGSVAGAKFVVLSVWSLMLTLLVLLGSLLAGFLADVGPLDDVDLMSGLFRLGLSGFLTAFLALTVGFAASVGRGYMSGFTAVIVLTAVTQIAVLFGTGGWFPYAAPGLYAMAGGEGIPDVSALQLLLAPLTTVILAWFTVRWWDRAEVV